MPAKKRTTSEPSYDILFENATHLDIDRLGAGRGEAEKVILEALTSLPPEGKITIIRTDSRV